MPSNSSSAQGQSQGELQDSPQDVSLEKPLASGDSADVPVLAVTAELPVDTRAPTPPIEVLSASRVDEAAGDRGETVTNGAAPTDGQPLQAAAADFTEPRPDDAEAPSTEELASLQQALFGAAPAEAMADEVHSAKTPAPLLPDVLTSAVHPLPGPRGEGATGAEARADEEEIATLDASDLVIDGESPDDDEATTGVRPHPASPFVDTGTPGPALGSADEEFLRRVVLPPVPRAARITTTATPAANSSLGFEDDHTVISAPPSPELLASMAAPPPPAAAPLPAPQAGGRDNRLRLTYFQLGGLILGSAIFGSIATNVLRPEEPRPLAAPLGAAAVAPVAPERVAPTPPPAPAAGELPAAAPPPPPPSEPSAPAAAGESSAEGEGSAQRGSKAAKRAGAKKPKKAKKVFVDPFQ